MPTDLVRTENLRLQLDGAVATLTLTRPARLNAMSPGLVGAEEALRIGLVNRMVPADELLPACRALADEICANTAYAVSMTKQVLGCNIDATSLRAAIELENRTQILGTHAASTRALMTNWKDVAARR